MMKHTLSLGLVLLLGAAFSSIVPLAAQDAPAPTASQPAFWEKRDVSHGTIHEHTYHAASLGQERPLVVYTPPGYDAAPEKKYPLFVLCHGRGDTEKSWIEKAGAHWIFDNLLAENKAVPAVVLMMNGHQPVQAPEGTDFRALALKAFQRELLEDALPFVEKNYRVLASAEYRALAGLSMGGMQSVSTAFEFPDKFAWIGSFSGAHAPDAARYAPFLNDPAKLNASFKLLWFGCGIEDSILARTVGHLALLNEKKVKHEWHLTDGGHTWEVWRVYLGEFAPRLFR